MGYALIPENLGINSYKTVLSHSQPEPSFGPF